MDNDKGREKTQINLRILIHSLHVKKNNSIEALKLNLQKGNENEKMRTN